MSVIRAPYEQVRAPGPPCQTPAVEVDEARAVLERYWRRVWHDRDLDAVEEFMADPYVRHSPSGTRSLGHDELKDELRHSYALLHGAVATVDDVAVTEDRVWARVTATGVNVQTGERSVLTWLGCYRVVDGRFAEAWSAALPDVDWRR